MQVQRSRKSSFLFQVLLDPQQLQELIHLDQGLLKKLIQVCSKHFGKALEKQSKSIYIFLANYKQIIESHSKIIKDSFSVNISLHFALTFTQNLLRENNETYAKAILKQTQKYLQIQDIDLLLLSICMSNLALLHSKSGKPRKSLAICLKGISIMEEHLDNMHQMKNKKRMIEDGVIFVNLLLIAKRNINRIMKKCNEELLYRKLLNMINKRGYNFSIKYLGSTSIFTSKFEIDESTIDLPIYDESFSQSEQNQLQNDFQMKIAQELNNIYNILKDIQIEPQVYYIKEYLVPSKAPNEISIKIMEQPPIIVVPQPQRSVSYVEHIIIDQWDTELSILKNNGLSTEKDYEYLGHLVFRIVKGKFTKDYTITQDNLFKILNTINIYDVLPYEMELRRLSSEEFLKKILLNFVQITQEGDLMIYPRAKSIIAPFLFKFCGEKSLIFVNHVRFRRFRVAICPMNSCETMYLELDFKHKQIYNYFKLKEVQHNMIATLSKKYHPEQNYGEQQYSYSPYKQIEIINNNFSLKISKILQEFESFLVEEEQNNLSEITTVINFTESYLYYQYTQYQQNIGQFHLLKYRSNANHIEVNVKNTFKTETPTGKECVKGSIIYSPQQFLKDFSINLKPSKKHLAAFSEIILQKFNLKIYQHPLQEEQEDIYEENSITEVPITSKCFFRKFISFQGYELPVTIQIITINNQKPVGIRITAYEPIKGNNSGLFIHITPEYWERPNLREQIQEDESMNNKVKRSPEDYNFKKCYFLTTWMEEQGFKRIFNRLTIVNRALQIRGMNNKFIRLDDFLKD